MNSSPKRELSKQEQGKEGVSEKIKEKLPNLPTSPGVYQYKNDRGKVIYVGKAINLRNRVRSYFQRGRPVDAKTKALVKNIDDVEVIVTDSEAEALILEDTLIKKFRPKYNIMLKDDKTYPYIRVTNEPYPRIFTTRTIIRDGSKYFGPITEVRNKKELLKTLTNMFQLRSCRHYISDETIENKKYKLCLDYHIDKCEGPCEGLISQGEYNENIKRAIQIINGKTHALEKKLEEEMTSLAEEMKFEEAAVVRNRLQRLKDYTIKQKIVSAELIDRDVLGLARLEQSACALIFKIRDGKLIGKRHFIIQKAEDQADNKIIQTVLEKWYMESHFVPKEIFLPELPEQDEFLSEWLKKQKGSNVELIIPKIGEKKKLVSMARTNAEFMLREYFLAIAKREQSIPRMVQSLQRDLRLKNLPRRIECFDNSHIQGSELVSSLVVFVDGRPKKSDYRKFKIRTVDKNDDFAAMREVISRRYNRLIDEKAEFPDLIIIDGGKGQLSSAYEILKDLGVNKKSVVIGLAKRLEEVFFPENSEPLLLPKTSGSLRLIQQLRDEAHRFAITFHRSLRDKRTLKTELTNIEGIGEKTAQKLLVEFGSVEGVKNASREELTNAVGNKAALSIIGYFEKKVEDGAD